MSQANVKTLGDLGQSLDSTAKTYPVLIGDNLGQRTLKFSLPLNQFIQISGVGNRQNIEEIEEFSEEFEAQRELVNSHSTGLAKYTMMGLVQSEIKERQKKGEQVPDEIISIRDGLGNPAYAALQPIVCNIRKCLPGGDDLEVSSAGDTNNALFYVTLRLAHRLWVVDGQHRREGFIKILRFLEKVKNTYRYPKRGLYEPSNYRNEFISEKVYDFWMSVHEIAISRCQVAVECHLGLVEEQEQQLFFDLNSKGKTVAKSLAYRFDHTDPINSFVADALIGDSVLPFVPLERDETNWHEDSGKLTRKDINNVTALLCLGKTSTKSATPAMVQDRTHFMIRFWEAIAKVKGFGKTGAKSTCLAAQPVVLKSLAKISHDLVYGHQNIIDHDGYKILLDAIISAKLDFSHQNMIWRALMMSETERLKEFPGLEKYLFIPSEINIDAGIYDQQNNWVRFGNKHNDIYPRLGDVIRWKLGLKVRPTVAKALEASDG